MNFLILGFLNIIGGEGEVRSNYVMGVWVGGSSWILWTQERKFENSWPLVESKKRKKRGDIIEI